MVLKITSRYTPLFVVFALIQYTMVIFTLWMASLLPDYGQFCAVSPQCLPYVMPVVVDGLSVADAAAVGVVEEHKGPVAAETASEDTQQDAAYGSGPHEPCILEATD